MIAWLLDPWIIALLAMSPFLFGRTAMAGSLLLLASLASFIAPWPLIDAAGAIVFAGWPQWQSRAIATLFAGMLWMDLFNPGAFAINYVLGWGQLLCLLLWATSRPQQNPLRGVPT